MALFLSDPLLLLAMGNVLRRACTKRICHIHDHPYDSRLGCSLCRSPNGGRAGGRLPDDPPVPDAAAKDQGQAEAESEAGAQQQCTEVFCNITSKHVCKQGKHIPHASWAACGSGMCGVCQCCRGGGSLMLGLTMPPPEPSVLTPGTVHSMRVATRNSHSH